MSPKQIIDTKEMVSEEKRPYAAPTLTTLTLQDTEAGARFTGQPENVDYTPS